MTVRDDDIRIRPGRSRDAGRGTGRRAQSLAAQVRRAAAKAGHTARRPSRGGGTGRHGRGRVARLKARLPANARRVVIKARIVRHKGVGFRAAPLARHLSYLQRDGVTRDGRDASMFDARSDAADGRAFAQRCEDDRHHFRFIVSPEDANRLEDLRSFTRELMDDMARDLETRLDWVAVDHWNTDNPHIHVLVRGIDQTGADLVIDRDYISEGLRTRAAERVTLELGPRSELEIQTALEQEVGADRWTSLDRRLQNMAAGIDDLVDLRPGSGADQDRLLLIGRAQKLERMGLADKKGPAIWSIRPEAEQTLRDLSIRGDIIKTMHRAMSEAGHRIEPSRLAVHDTRPEDPIIGRLVARGLYDELQGTAYAVIDGIDGRTHHLRFEDLEYTGDAKTGALVETRIWQSARGEPRLSLATRCDLTLAEQIHAPGATWLDRQLVARKPLAMADGFGAEVRDAMAARARHLESAGLAQRRGQGYLFARDLIETLKASELGQTIDAIGRRTGLAHQPSAPGDYVSGIYRERVMLASGRFAMIDGGLGFQLVPWRPALDHHLGQHITGTMMPGGGVDWSLGRGRGLGL
ncbi:relaxase/mobilization nuclease domain-containing protein [Sphingomonas fennica]|uniref:Type VI secretion protein n=1 Tax=Edaphosphingomonas fennica TaxID=114404 RepID=A0A2T4HUV0_9SPHN|nr:VirD2 family relaxase/mobilization nuclease [Sphingomonas fennica]PTD19576.1 type VI secretion protein [Sphingomonas fennica]